MSTATPRRPSAPGLAQWFFSGLPQHARGSLAVRVGGVGLEFLSLLAIARLLDAEAYGAYAVAMTLVAIFAVPAAVGFDRLVVRELAAFRALGDWTHARGLLRSGLFTVLAASAAAAFATWAIGRLFLPATTADPARALLLAAALVPMLALARLRQAALQGLGSVTAGLVPESLLQPAIVILLAAAAIFSHAASPGASLAVGFQVFAAFAALVLGTWLLRRRLPPALRQAAPRYRTRAWWGAGCAFMVLVFMTAALANVDTLLVSRLAGPADAGTYKVAVQLAMLVGLPLTAISVAMAPVIAEMHAAGRISELQLSSRAAARAITAAAAVLFIGVAAGGPWILGAFGPEFARAYGPTLILASAYLGHSAMATSGYLLIMSAHETLVMGVFAAGAALNFAGCLVLVPRFGIVGAAISSAASLCLASGSCAILARSKLGIDGTVFARLPRRTTPA